MVGVQKIGNIQFGDLLAREFTGTNQELKSKGRTEEQEWGGITPTPLEKDIKRYTTQFPYIQAFIHAYIHTYIPINMHAYAHMILQSVILEQGNHASTRYRKRINELSSWYELFLLELLTSEVSTEPQTFQAGLLWVIFPNLLARPYC